MMMKKVKLINYLKHYNIYLLQIGIDFSLPNKLSNLKSHKQLSTEITELGAKVFDLISKESDLKVGYIILPFYRKIINFLLK